MTGLVITLAVLVGGGGEAAPAAVQACLRQHPQLTLAPVSGVTCPAGGATQETLAAVVQKDLSGDELPDTAFVVVSRATPVQFGVVVFNGGRLPAATEHWVVALRVEPIRGLSVFPSPYGNWLLVHGCTKQQGGAYGWDGKQYTPAPVM